MRRTSNRASEFVFVGLGAATGLLAYRCLKKPGALNGWQEFAVRIGTLVFFGIVFVGGMTVGWPDKLVPGPLLVEGGPRRSTQSVSGPVGRPALRPGEQDYHRTTSGIFSRPTAALNDLYRGM